MSRPVLAVAAPNPYATDAAEQIARQGGNAIDAAVAAMAVACVSEPAMVSFGGGGFITIAPAEGSAPVTIDAYVEMPGRGLPPEAFGQGLTHTVTEYNNGMTLTMGHGSVATPGALAGLELAQQRYGTLPWRVVLEPAIALARNGFSLGHACSTYFDLVRDYVFCHDPATVAALHHDDGTPLAEGDTVHLVGLAEFLEQVATDGSDVFYRGEVAQRLANDMAAHGGLITIADLAAYQPIIRPATAMSMGDWRLFTNPPPSIGGPVLTALVSLLAQPHDAAADPAQWNAADIAFTYQVMRAVLERRATQLDIAPDLQAAGEQLLAGIRQIEHPLEKSGATVHVSVVDVDQGACSITMSSGYGNEINVPGTGVWLNNCLGERELNVTGFHVLPPGRRLASNMAPSVGRHTDGSVLAIGSPGADRITTAMALVLTAMNRGCGVQQAVNRARIHLERTETGSYTFEYENGISLQALDLLPDAQQLPRREYPPNQKYFGGVAVTVRDADGAMTAASDPRRDAAAKIVPAGVRAHQAKDNQ